MSSEAVELRSMTPDDVGEVVGAATRGAAPADVMPPDDDPGPATWTPTRRRRYDAFLRSRLRALPDGRREVSFVVLVDGAVAGVARVLAVAPPEPDAYEVGLWLGAPHRGRGVGRAALDRVIAHVRGLGGSVVVAETAPSNRAALSLLHAAGAPLPGPGGPEVVVARIDLR